MFRGSLFTVALILATAGLNAQTTAPKAGAPAAARAAADPYVPAIMQDRMTTLTGCLQKNNGWVLTGATAAGQKDAAPTTYRLEGIGDARLALFEGKRIEATGAPPLPKGAAAPPTTTANAPMPFEATAVKAATPDACS